MSKRVADLEATLGRELLRRSTRRLVPTDQGHALYERMCPLLRELDDVIDETGEREGELRARLRIRIRWLEDSSLVARRLCAAGVWCVAVPLMPKSAGYPRRTMS